MDRPPPRREEREIGERSGDQENEGRVASASQAERSSPLNSAFNSLFYLLLLSSFYFIYLYFLDSFEFRLHGIVIEDHNIGFDELDNPIICHGRIVVSFCFINCHLYLFEF